MWRCGGGPPRRGRERVCGRSVRRPLGPPLGTQLLPILGRISVRSHHAARVHVDEPVDDAAHQLAGARLGEAAVLLHLLVELSAEGGLHRDEVEAVVELVGEELGDVWVRADAAEGGHLPRDDLASLLRHDLDRDLFAACRVLRVVHDPIRAATELPSREHVGPQPPQVGMLEVRDVAGPRRAVAAPRTSRSLSLGAHVRRSSS
mmetsp:Transcript_25213/g.72560  ORF Transcript_25213/g.72560 Transcript_25213/m.72560 type:complete len:204 (-) Transcript_25213:208-819(-)